MTPEERHAYIADLARVRREARAEALEELILWIADMDPELADAARDKFLRSLSQGNEGS